MKIGKEIILHSRSRVYSAIKQMENKYLQLTRVIMKRETKERWLIGSSTKQGPVRRQLQLQLFNKVLQEKQLLVLLENCYDKHQSVTEPHSVVSDSATLWTVGSSVHGILKARILEWVVLPSSRGSS